MLKAVLFDLDGTVLDTLPDLCACMNEALEQFGCRAITQEETLANKKEIFAGCSLL